MGALGTWLRLERGDHGGSSPVQAPQALQRPQQQHWPFVAGDGFGESHPSFADIIFIAEDGGRHTCSALRRLMPEDGGGGGGGGSSTGRWFSSGGSTPLHIPHLRCIDACLHACYASPNMSCLVDTAARLARTPVLALVNSDIALGPDFVRAVHHLFQPAHPGSASEPPPGQGQVVDNIIAVGRRSDVRLDGSAQQQLDFADPAWWAHLHTRAATHGSLHSEYGVDYIVAADSLWAAAAQGRGPLAMPPFVAGAFRWDSFVLAEAVVHPGVAVVDVTLAVTAVHLQVGVQGEAPTHSRRAGAAHNDRLARSLTGDRYLMGKTTLADYELVVVGGGGGGDGEQLVLMPVVTEKID